MIAGILTEETQAREAERRATDLASYSDAVRRRLLRDLPVSVFYTHFMGPVVILAQLQEKGEMEITDDVLRLTFEGIERAVGVPDEPDREGAPSATP